MHIEVQKFHNIHDLNNLKNKKPNSGSADCTKRGESNKKGKKIKIKLE